MINLLILIAMVSQTNQLKQKDHSETITLGAGCFWCVEAVFERVKGVEKVVSGYSGGSITNPTYKEVTSGLTGHAEVVQVTFDPNVISMVQILEIFWKTHDPTTLNRQGADIGTQYRSAVFYHNEQQKITAMTLKDKLEKAAIWSNSIVTEITALKSFYQAEEYHQEYYRKNPNQPYCQFVIVPKLEKFDQIFSEFSK